MGMSKERDFIVVLWLRLNAKAPDLMKMIAELEPFEPFESTEYEGVRDFHWKFPEFREAENFVASLKKLSEAPEVLVLRLTNYEDVRITLKDSRQTTH
jgi:hypothetical protein